MRRASPPSPHNFGSVPVSLPGPDMHELPTAAPPKAVDKRADAENVIGYSFTDGVFTVCVLTAFVGREKTCSGAAIYTTSGSYVQCCARSCSTEPFDFITATLLSTRRTTITQLCCDVYTTCSLNTRKASGVAGIWWVFRNPCKQDS